MPSRGRKRSRGHQKINVWIVDDNARFCAIVQDALNESKTIRCSRKFHRARTFLSELNPNTPRPQVILLDVRMPGINGLAAIPTIRKLSPDSKTIIISAYDDHRYILRAFSEGASGYLLKTLASAGQIIEAIEVVAKGRVIMDQNISSNLFKALMQRYQPNEQYGLTTREKEIVELVAEGQSSKQIADTLGISEKTMIPHLKNIFLKLHVHNRASLVAKVMKEQIV